jgi:hypothetical protein
MFNYSLAAATLLAAGYGAAIDKHPLVAVAIGIVGCLVTQSFRLIDKRNDKLVRRGERVLKAFEKIRFPEVGADQEDKAMEMPGGILIVNEQGARKQTKRTRLELYRLGTHRVHLPLIEWIFFAAFALGTLGAFIEAVKDPPIEPTAQAIDSLTKKVENLNESLIKLVDRVERRDTGGSGAATAQPPSDSKNAPH